MRVGALLCLLSAALPAAAAEAPPPRLLRLTCFVQEPSGGPVDGLPSSGFTVTVDGRPAKIADFVHNPDTPVAVGVLFDHGAPDIREGIYGIDQLLQGIYSMLRFEDDLFMDSYGFVPVRFVSPGASRKDVRDVVSRFRPHLLSSERAVRENFGSLAIPPDTVRYPAGGDMVPAVVAHAVRTLREMPQPRKALIWVMSNKAGRPGREVMEALDPSIPVLAVVFTGSDPAADRLAALQAALREIGSPLAMVQDRIDAATAGRMALANLLWCYEMAIETPPAKKAPRAPRVRIALREPGLEIYYPARPGGRRDKH
ncbi:MAG: hypothetical protein KA419_04590 [Acidobacteria bacterium]|nr:hypothetical protein [Acidobacteriota bacterium]